MSFIFCGVLLVEEAHFPKAGPVGVSHDDMVKDFDFQKLAGADEVAGHFDVCFAGGVREVPFKTQRKLKP